MGILSNHEERVLANIIDDCWEFDNYILEAADGKLARMIIKLLDRQLRKIPEPYKELVHNFVKYLEEERYAEASAVWATIGEMAIDTPLINNKPQEKVFYKAISDMILMWVRDRLNEKNKK